MHPFQVLLTVFALLALATLVLLFRWERRLYSAKGKGQSWLWVRVSSLPIALVLAAMVVLPAASTRGMEALAMLYLLLLTVGPVFWVGAHWLVGRATTPPLDFGESLLIAISPIVALLALSSLAHLLQGPAWKLLRTLGLV